MRDVAVKKRAARALARQLAYQEQWSRRLPGREAEIMERMEKHSREVGAAIERVAAMPEDARVLEVGSGAKGIIFFFGGACRIGVDPLADRYRHLFPAWQSRAVTLAAYGEALPFADGSFDIVLCDNVVDHAENPRRIVEEIARVLAPGGLLYFTVNVHHSIYRLASGIHAAWRALGIPFEITPFADHTVHLTRVEAGNLFEGLPLRLLHEADDIARVKGHVAPTHRRFERHVKRIFFKNAKYEVIAVRR